MTHKCDRLFHITVLGYIILPLLIFFLTWLQPILGIMLSVVLCTASWYSYAQFQFENNTYLALKAKPITLIFSILIVFIWLFLSGIGSYSFQHDDHVFRNAIFNDLSLKDWPVTYHLSGFEKSNPLEGQQTVLTYYLAFWLPAALVGKIFGATAGNLFLLFWSIIGVILVLYFLASYLRHFSWKIIFLFTCWGSLYYLGSLYSFPAKEVLKGQAYLWSGTLLYADGNTGLIYWTFNQTIVPWLLILLIFRQFNKKTVLFFTALIFPFGPFAFVGFAPILLWFIFKNYDKKLPYFWLQIKPYLSWVNLLAGGSIFLIWALYFSGNSSGNVLGFAQRDITIYLLFIWVSIGLLFVLLWSKFRQNSLFWLCIGLLLVLPFGQLGFGLDFPARVSIPAMFVLMLLSGQILVENSNLSKAIVFYLCLAGLGHNMQTARSLYYTTIYYVANSSCTEQLANFTMFHNLAKTLKGYRGQNLILKNDLGTLANPKNELVRNFMAPTSTFFYKYLAKKHD